ncbi:FAD-dependent monooxygenase [Amycolatopsis sp. H20-H5]|uniref:FAD-dependent monooxygenase n=1 Tax=Amycolatopsis sp. H20-H5 TaxID=3046309 RepID=UPI002DB874DE|nr:FAD-dependent monooxygenase [Amycolatopsis sp. H20-H5]MEC3977380.1 FAD-dependent monooxygenase [Amycolatopsis sp. H20-H5]
MDEQVVIVGAGPVGTLLACELLQQGIAVRLIDASREHSAHSRATIIWPRLLELLRHNDLTDRLADNGHPIDGVTYLSQGRPLGTAWMNRLRDTPYPFAVAISQHETERIIEDRLGELGGKIERGVRLSDLRNATGPRPVAVLQGPDGTTEEVETSWLVGADGAHSSVRKLVGSSFEGAQFDVSFAITDAEIVGDAPQNVVSYCYAPQGSLALGPLGSGVCRVAVSVPHPEDDTPPSREFFQAIVDERGPGRNVLGELRFSATFRVHARTASRFRSGHCLLVGDAAHIMSPAAAQGMNTGLQDAINLAWRLGGVLNGRLPESVIDGYDTERRDAAHAVAKITALQTEWGLLRKAPQIAVRDVALRAASAGGLLQRALGPLVAQTGVRYPSAARNVLLDAFSGKRVRPGERLPVLPMPGTAAAGEASEPEVRVAGRTWTAIKADEFTVLCWPGRRLRPDWEEVIRRACQLAGPDAVVIEARYAEGPLSDALGNDAILAVVRPDGYLHATMSTSHVEALGATLTAARSGHSPAWKRRGKSRA